MQPLQGKVAVVTGASRGAGRGIPVRCDHTDDAQVAALFERVRAEQGKLEILVNNAWGGYEDRSGFKTPFWEQPLWRWEKMFDAGVRTHFVTSRFAAPLMLPQKQGLIVSTTFWDRNQRIGGILYDTAKWAVNRLAFDMAGDLRPHGIAAVALSPGWMRTETVLEEMGVTEATWADSPHLKRTESVQYIGRAVLALATDPNVMARSGQVFAVGDLAQEYGFTDVDGSQPPAYRLGQH